MEKNSIKKLLKNYQINKNEKSEVFVNNLKEEKLTKTHEDFFLQNEIESVINENYTLKTKLAMMLKEKEEFSAVIQRLKKENSCFKEFNEVVKEKTRFLKKQQEELENKFVSLNENFKRLIIEKKGIIKS